MSKVVIAVMVAVFGVKEEPTLIPASNLNCPCLLNKRRVLANETAETRKLIEVPPVLRSTGSLSTTVCTVSGQNLSKEAPALRMTFSSASNTSLFLNRLMFCM